MKSGTWQKIGVIAAVISSAVAILQPALENLTLQGWQFSTLKAEDWPTFLGLMLLVFAIFLGWRLFKKQDSLQENVDLNTAQISEIKKTLFNVRKALPEEFMEPSSKKSTPVAEDGSSQDGS